jgi:hypothetical protein
MDGFNVAYSMNDLMCQIIWIMDSMTCNSGGNVLVGNSNLNYSWKLLEAMLTCIIESYLTSQL